MKLTKRLMALLMVLTLLVSNLPLGVLATETPETEPAATEAAVVETAAATEPASAVQEPAVETTEPAVEETVAETTAETTEAVAEETTEETVAETVAETVEETVPETTEETVPETTEEEVEEQPEEAPASTNEPYLSWRWLNNDGNGWYEDPTLPLYTDDGIMAYGNRWCIFYLNVWNDSTGAYDAYPVNLTTDSQYLDIRHVTEMDDGNQSVAAGQANGAYFTHIMGVNTIEGAAAQVSCSYGGETYTFDYYIRPREMGYYSAPSATLENVLHTMEGAHLDPDSDEYSIYFIKLDPVNCVYDSFDWEVNTWGQDYGTLYCDGEDFITMNDLGNGVIEFKLNPKYVKYVKEHKTYDWKNFCMTVYGDYHMADNTGSGNFHQELWVSPDFYDDYHLSFGWLDYNNDSWYFHEENVEGNQDWAFIMEACSKQYGVFFLNSYNESTGLWDRTPVIPGENSDYVTISKVKGDENEAQPAEGEVYGDYFVRITSSGTLDTLQYDMTVEYNGRTLRFPAGLSEKQIGFYRENRISPDTIYQDDYFHLSEDAQTQSLYLLKSYPGGNPRNITFRVDDFRGCGEFCDGELINVTALDNDAGWKIDLNPDYIESAKKYRNSRWLQFRIIVEGEWQDDYSGQSWPFDMGMTVNPPVERTSFIMARQLEGSDNGFYNPYNAPMTDLGMSAAFGNNLVFYLQVWDEEAQNWIEEVPVIPTSNSANLTITPIDPAEIREGEADSEYFCRLASNTMDYEIAEISVTYNGETYYAPLFIYEDELAFYSEHTVSMDTIIRDGQFILDANASENAVYLLWKDPGEFTLQDMNWYVETFGRDAEYEQYLTGSKLVTMTEISGGWKFTVDPGFVAAAAANVRYDWMNFNIQVSGQKYDDQGNFVHDYRMDVWAQPPEANTEPYITAHRLQNDGDGFYVYHVSSEEPSTNFGARAMDWTWMIFYLHTWNETTQSWESTPIIPKTNSDKLTIAKFDELDEKHGDATIREDQTMGEYFVNVEAWGTLDYSKESIYYEHNGTTVTAPFHVYTRDLSFYDSDEISVESCMPDRQFDIDKTSEETKVYFRTYNTGGRYIDDVQWEVDTWGEDYFQYTYGEPLVHMEKLGDGTGYEFIVNQNYVNWVLKNYKFDWKNFRLRVTGNWYNENGHLIHEFQDECWINPPRDTDPWICAYRLENQGEGWFVVEDSITTEYSTRGLDWSWYIFFLFTWDEAEERYVPEPIIPYENSDNLKITKLFDVDDGHEKDIREDYAATDRPNYFVQVRSYNYIDGEHHEMMYYTDDDGNTYELPFTIYPRETGYYSEPTRSVETAIVNGQFDLDSAAAENAVYYLINTPYEHTFENVSFRVDTWGQDYSAMYCDGEDLITWEPVTGGYKIVINPKYVQAMATGTDWRNFCIWAEWDRVSPDGHVDHENWENIWISPPERFDPYLSWGYLDDTGDGYFFDPDRMGGLDHYWRFEMSGMNNRWVVFFLNTYDEATGEWTRTPFVPTITGENIYMYTLPEAGFVIAENAEYAEYYRLIKSRGRLNGSTFTIGCENVPGYEDLTFTGYVIDREVAFYTTLEPSVDTILHQGYTTLSAEGENVFYISKLFDDAELRNFKLEIDTWGEDYNRFCDGEKFVTVEETARGYKITVNPKYVQYVKDHVHDNWKNFCLYFETDVYNGNGDFIITWGDVLWVNPPEVAGDLNEIVNDQTMSNEEKKEAVQNMDTEDLKDAMENNESVVEQIKTLEEEVGTKVVVDTTDEAPIESGEIIGAGLNKVEDETKDITLVIDKPAEEKSAEEIGEKYDSDVNIQFSMTLDNVQNTENLDVPVMVTLAVPEGVDIDLLVLLHYHGNGVDQVNFTVSVKDGVTYITFALDGFSDFVMTHQKIGDVNRDGSINDGDAIYVIWHTLFPEMYPLSVTAGDITRDGSITDADAMEILWKALGL